MHGFLRSLSGSPEVTLVPVALAFIAFWALLVNRRSAATARRALGVSARQELRGRPDLRVESLSATCEVGRDVQSYIFDLLVRNPSANANSVVSAELWLDYFVAGEPMLLKLPWRLARTPPDEALALPLNLDANSAVSGSLHFDVPRQLLGGVPVDRLRLALTDTFDNVHVVATDFVQERVEQVEDSASG